MNKGKPTQKEVDYYKTVIDAFLNSAPRSMNFELLTLIIVHLVQFYDMGKSWTDISLMISSLLDQQSGEEFTQPFFSAKEDADDFLAKFLT